MGNFYQLRIFVFYVSKQGLIETFKNVNKLRKTKVKKRKKTQQQH